MTDLAALRICTDLVDIAGIESDPAKRRLIVGWDRIWHQGDFDAVDELMCEQYIRVTRDDAPIGRDDFKSVVKNVRAAFPDLHLSVRSMVREGAVISTLWHVFGTHHGSILNTPPTDLPVRMTGVTWSTLSGSCVSHDWLTWDPSDMLSALGIISLQAVRHG